MIWARRMIGAAEEQQVHDQFEDLFVKLGCPGQMMLVAAPGQDPDRTAVFASLPNPPHLAVLTGFESIGESDLPAEVSLLVGYNVQFEKWFRRLPGRPRL